MLRTKPASNSCVKVFVGPKGSTSLIDGVYLGLQRLKRHSRQYRKIKVQVTVPVSAPKLQVFARTGYYAPESR